MGFRNCAISAVVAASEKSMYLGTKKWFLENDKLGKFKKTNLTVKILNYLL